MDMRNLEQDYIEGSYAVYELPTALIDLVEQPYEGQPPNTRVHSAVWKSLGFFFFGILGAFAITFRSSPQALFMLAICGIYLTMYLAGPLLVMKTAGETLDDGTPLAEFLERPFSTYTGIITGREAWFQICIIPGALFLTAVGMGIVISIVT